MTPNEVIRRITQQAMERHRLSQRGLAHEIGCGDGSIAKLLDEQEVRLTQEQLSLIHILTGVFAYLAVTGQIAQDFMTVYAVVIAFYFGTQSQNCLLYTSRCV